MVYQNKNGETPQLLGIIGNPIKHSLSADLYNHFFKRAGLPYVYLPFQLEQKSLKNLITTLRLMDVESLNVTIPFKEAIVPYLDRLDQSAAGPQTVNLIVRKKNQFVGYNTDGAGWRRAIQEQTRFRPAGKTAVILGAGGTARTLSFVLAKDRIRHLILLNRSPNRSLRLARFLKKKFPRLQITTAPLTAKSFRAHFPAADLLVNTTPQLLKLPIALLPQHAVVSDVIYRSFLTPLIRGAKKRGLKSCDGLWMFVHQAVLNLQLWTGHF